MEINKLAAQKVAFELAFPLSVECRIGDGYHGMMADNWATWQLAIATMSQEKPSIKLNGYQLKQALDLAWPDGNADLDQGETVVVLQQLDEFMARDEDGVACSLPAGLYLSYDDLPTEGVFELNPEQEST